MQSTAYKAPIEPIAPSRFPMGKPGERLGPCAHLSMPRHPPHPGDVG